MRVYISSAGLVAVFWFEKSTKVRIAVCRHFVIGQSPSITLRELTATGKLKSDASQAVVISNLDKVWAEAESHSSHPKWLKSFSRPKIPRGLYIYGAVGRGKTMLMDLFYDCCSTEQKQRLHFNEFMRYVHSQIYIAKKSQTQSRLIKFSTKSKPINVIDQVAAEIVQRAWLLCLDEFQVTDVADAMIMKFLFTELFKNGITLVTTSNRAPDDLYKNGLQRSSFLPFISILKSHCDVVNLDSHIDYRTEGSRLSKTYYFISTDPDADDELDTIFKMLAAKETARVSSKTIIVQGRNVVLRKTCGGILDSTFAELCDAALGASDYLQFAQVFHTIIIRNVPRMDLTIRNQTRRFIQLIDILYDYRVRLLISAITQPMFLFSNEVSPDYDVDRILMDDLRIAPGSENASASQFTGSEEIFAFERTVSRLMEMQTSAYWEKWERK